MSFSISDDFTKELKVYFLNSLLEGLNQESLKPGSELTEFCQSAAKDAEANDFLFLRDWIQVQFLERLTAENLPARLKRFKGYVTELLTECIDSEILYQKYAEIQPSEKGIFLHFEYLQENYLVSVKNILEVVSAQKLFKLPVSQDHIFGLILFRGEPVPVLNLFDQSYQPESYLICENLQQVFALPISRAHQIYELDHQVMSQIQPIQNLMYSDLILGVVGWNSRNMLLLDLEKVGAA